MAGTDETQLIYAAATAIRRDFHAMTAAAGS
jgi:hypothetical protein